ncbi:MAG: indole-3-glycerol phosphate synthase TrpC [Dehalococcoidia bacterium]|nr:indole-3-glycerol phosphate synthase TrpC [Dehalococcoidia bacterium]
MILDRIVADNRQQLEDKKRQLPVVELQRLASEQPPALDLATALRGDGIQLIAEVKKASPSRGVIRPDFDPVEIARIYAGNGAAAISVLTESLHFQGNLDHLRNIRRALPNNLPLLRKDFIVDPYQVYESRAYGADSLLLIVAILKPEKLQELLKLSHELNMSCLVEVHNEAETEIALNSLAEIIGINNRDLNTFEVDTTTTARLRPLIPPDRIVVSESGIKERTDIEKLSRLGIDAVLIGESLMAAHDIAARMRELL